MARPAGKPAASRPYLISDKATGAGIEVIIAPTSAAAMSHHVRKTRTVESMSAQQSVLNKLPVEVAGAEVPVEQAELALGGGGPGTPE